MKKLRAAVVGVGYLGRFHAQKYKNNPNVELVGVFDQDPARAQLVATELGVSVFSKLSDLKGKVDLATVATATKAHFEVAQELLQMGIHLNVEKPITSTTKEARALVELAQKNKLKLAVGHIERFNPALQELKKQSTSIKHLDLVRHATFKLRGSDVSVLHDLMIHDLDILFWFLGEPISFMATGAKILTNDWDTCELSAKFKNGTSAHVSVSRVSNTAQRSARVINEKSILSANTGTFEIQKLTPVDKQAEAPMKNEQWTLEKADALQRETDAFIQAVLDGTEPLVTGRDGLFALEWVEKIESELAHKV